MQKLSAIIPFQRLQGLNQKFWNDSLFQTLISTVWEMKSFLMTSHHSDWSSSSGGKSSSWWKWEDKDALCEKDIVEYQWSYWPLAISALTHYPGHNLALLGMLIFKIEKNHAYKTKFDICKTGNWIISNQAFFNTCMHKLLCLSSVRKKNLKGYALWCPREGSPCILHPIFCCLISQALQIRCSFHWNHTKHF